MIDRHAVQALVQVGLSTKDIAAQMGVSTRSVQRIAQEPPVGEPDDQQARSARRVGRPPLPDRVAQRMRELAAEDPQAPPLEVLRQLREEGVELGESTFYRVFRIEKAKLPSELMVRFEGVAGEFGQFDFGVADVRLLDGRTKRIHFAAYRLKHSRWVWVVIVPDERVESLVHPVLSVPHQAVARHRHPTVDFPRERHAELQSAQPLARDRRISSRRSRGWPRGIDPARRVLSARSFGRRQAAS